MTLKEKYDRIDVNAIPANLRKEVAEIAHGTNGFADEDLNKIYEDNFNDLFKLISRDYPEAIAPKMKVRIKPEKKMKLHPKVKSKLVIKKKSSDDPDCEEAKKEVKQIEKKKQLIAKARHDAPKKKSSTIVKEKQMRALQSAFKTKSLKTDSVKAAHLTAGIADAYRKQGLDDIADHIAEHGPLLMDKHYKQAKKGAQLSGMKDGDDGTTNKEFKIYKEGTTTNGKVTVLSKGGEAFNREAKIEKYLNLGYKVYDMDDKEIVK